MKKLLSVLLSALMVLSLVPAGVFVFTAAANEGTTVWATVDGSYDGDLFINTADDWKAFLSKSGDYANASVYLCAAIDVSSVTGVGPIADFKGTFDGQSFTVTGIKTGVFTTLSGALKNVTLNLAYTDSADGTCMITTLNGSMSGVSVTGKLKAAGGNNMIVRDVCGAITGMTITNVTGYAGGNGGRYLGFVKAGSAINGVTITGYDSYIHAAVGTVEENATVKNLTFKEFGRMGVFQLNGTVENLTVDDCKDITIRNAGSKGFVRNLVVKNVTNRMGSYSLVYTSGYTAGFTIDGLTVDNTTTVPLVGYGAIPAAMTIKNVVVNNGVAVYFGDVQGTIDGLTMTGCTNPVIGKITGTVTNVVNNSGVPVVSGGTLEIATADQWKNFLSNKTYSYEGVTVKLTFDEDFLDVSGVTGVGPIADFKGTFDGQGKTIKGITTSVFTTMSGTVKNVTFDVSYDGLAAHFITTMSGTLTNVTFNGVLHGQGITTTDSSGNHFIVYTSGTINGLTIHNVKASTNGGGHWLETIQGTARITDLTLSGNECAVQYMIGTVQTGAVFNNLVMDNTNRSAIHTFSDGAIINGLTCKNHTNIIFLNLNGTVNDLVIDGGNASTELSYRTVTSAAGAINNLTVKNMTYPVLNAGLTAWPTNLKLTGKFVVNNSVFPFGALINKPISEKLFAGYIDGEGNAVENIATHTGDATVKLVDPKMVIVHAQLKDQGDGKYTIRFLTTVDRLDGYESVKITINGNSKTYGKAMTTVYSSVLAGTETLDADDVSGTADSKYIATYEIRNIPASAVDTVFGAMATVTMADGSTITSEREYTYSVSSLSA